MSNTVKVAVAMAHFGVAAQHMATLAGSLGSQSGFFILPQAGDQFPNPFGDVNKLEIDRLVKGLCDQQVYPINYGTLVVEKNHKLKDGVHPQPFYRKGRW